MKYVRTFAAFISCLLLSPALAQWQVPTQAIPVGKGASVQGFGSAAPGVIGGALTSNGASSAPSFRSGIVYDLRSYAVAPKTPDTVCNGSGDDTATFQAAVNAAATLPPAGRIIVPATNCLVSSPGINISDKYNIRFEGQGAGNPYTGTRARITYTSAAGTLLNLKGAVGFVSDGVEYYYNNAAYAGDLIDLRQSGISGTARISFRNFVFSGTDGTAVSANSLVRLGGTIDVDFRGGFFQLAVRGLHNSGSEGAANSITVKHTWFQNISSQPITMAGNAWSLQYNSPEPLTSGAAGWIIGTGECIGCDVSHNNIGDANALGTWMDWSAGPLIGGTVLSNVIDTGLHAMNFGSSKAVTATGNWLGFATDTGAIIASSASKMTIKSNSCLWGTFPRSNQCATIFSGSLPSTSEVDNNDGNGIQFTGPGITLAQTGSISFGGDTSIQAAADILSFAGASVGGYTFDFTVYPSVNRAGSLGTATKGWADIYLGGSTSGIGQLKAPAVAGSAVWTLPTATGTLANGASSPLVLNSGTGNLTCPTCVTSSGGGAVTGTTPITVSAAGAVSLDAAGVTYAKIQNLGALAVMGRSANSSGVGADIQATAASDAVLRESGSVIGFGPITTGGIANNAVTLAKLATQGANTALVNATSGAAVPTAQSIASCSTAGSALTWTTNTGFGCNTSITATTATNATNTAITDDTTTNATVYPTWVTAATGNLPQKVASTKLTFNPSTGVLSSTSFTGAGTGLTGTATSLTAGNVTTNANLTGDVTSVGNATTLTNAPVIAKVLTGYSASAGTVAATDSILQGFQKLGGLVDNAAWTAYTSSVTPSGGSFTVTVNSAAYKQIGKTVFFNVAFTISAFVTANNVTMLLPVTPATDGGVTGINSSVFTPVHGPFSAGSTTVIITNSGGGSSIQNNGKYAVWGSYQAN